jgi:hypothetical protein
VEVLRGVEPEAVALLPSGRRAAVAVHVGLHPPLPPAHVPQELEVQLVVRPLEHVPVRHLHALASRCVAFRFVVSPNRNSFTLVMQTMFRCGVCAHVERDDDSGGVVGGQLDAGAEEAVEVRVPGREPGACNQWNSAAMRPTTQSQRKRRHRSGKKRTETCPLVEGDVHPLAAAVEREVGVAEQLRVPLPEGERGGSAEKLLLLARGGHGEARRQQDRHKAREGRRHCRRSASSAPSASSCDRPLSSARSVSTEIVWKGGWLFVTV